MGRILKVRLIIERQNANLDHYSPKVFSANVTTTFPWSCPSALIEIITNPTSSSSSYIPPVQVDDIVRLQVNTKYSTSELNVWQNIFEGRISKITTKLGYDNRTVLACRGHGEELLYRLITADYADASKTTGYMFDAITTSYLSRLTDASPSLIDTAGSTSISNYNVNEYSKYVVDVLHDFELFEDYGYIFDVVTSYDNDDNLSAAYLEWQAVPSVPNTSVQARENSIRIIYAEFGSSIENLLEDVTVFGSDPGTQYEGNSAAGSPTYGTRYHVQTDLSLLSNNVCTALATAIRTRWANPIITGHLRIVGDPNIKVGDLISCYFPSIEINGSTIDGDYRVKRVNHDIDQTGWVTTLDLGEYMMSPHDIMAQYHAKARLDNASLIS